MIANYPYHHGGGPNVLAWLFFVAFLVLIALAIFALVRGVRPQLVTAPPQVPPPLDGPLAAVRMRYARGEISREDFLQAEADLGGAGPPSASQAD